MSKNEPQLSNPMDFMIDYETLGNAPEGAVVDLAIVCFKDDPYNPPTFQELISSGLQVKFQILAQKQNGSYPRKFDKDAIEWWKLQSVEARACLSASINDVSLADGVRLVEDYLKSNNVDPWKSLGWCRGQSFDFSIMVDMIRQVHNTRETFELEWCKFWNQRDVRTGIERTLMKRGMTECPLPTGTLTGFIAHNSIHDVAKDILGLLYAQRYALGLEECPSEEDTDPHSVKKKR